MRAEDIGFYVPAAADAAQVRDLAVWAERIGVHSLWFHEPGLARDPFVHAAAAAAVTERIHLGIGLVSIWKQLPAALAATISTFTRLAPGRVSVVLGPWHEPAATQAGASRHHPVSAMGDATGIIRSLLAGERTSYDGEVFSVADAELGVPPSTQQVPLLWGGVGPRLLQAAGELADGVQLNYLQTIERNRAIIRCVQASAAAAGRDPDSLRRPAIVLTSVGEDRPAELERARAIIESSPTARHEAGIPDDQVVTAEDVAALTCAGTVDDCLRGIESHLAVGAWPVVVFDHDPRTTLERLLAVTR